MKKISYLTTAVVLTLGLTACNDEVLTSMGSEEDAESGLRIDGSCNTYTLRNAEKTGWVIADCPEWITPLKDNGTANEKINFYVESNSSHATRCGDITIKYDNGKVQTTRAEQSDEQPTWSLQRGNAVGWSFDVRTYNDSRGLRAQIFNTAKIQKWETNNNEEIYAIDSVQSSTLDFYYGEDASNLSDNMAGKLNVNGKFNMFSLDLQASFGKDALNNSKRIFSWIRGIYQQCELTLMIGDISNAQKNDWFTADFKLMRDSVTKVIKSGTSAQREAIIRNLIDQYGTHVILAANLGGCYDYYYSTILDENADKLNVKAAIEFGYAEKFKLKADATYKDNFESMNNETIEKFSVKGGDAIAITTAVETGTLDSLTTETWLKTLKEGKQFELLNYQLEDISILFSDDDVIDAIEDYLARLYYSENPITRVKAKDF